MGKPARVLCIGGGYAAMGLKQSLARAHRRGVVELTVVDQNNFHTFHGMAAEMIVGKLQPGQIINPSRRLFHPGRFVCAHVESIDTVQRSVVVSRSLDARQYQLDYDHLVVALGTQDDLSRYPGIAQHAIKLKNYDGCLELRNHIVRMLELAELEADAHERKRLLTFVIAGGNFAGVEVASELADYFDILCRREFRRIPRDEIRIIVVHSGPRLLPELDSTYPRLVDYVERIVDSQRVEVLRNARLMAATPAEVIVTGDLHLPSRPLVSGTGSAPNPLVGTLPFDRDDRGRLVADAQLRVSTSANVWSAGDCAAVPHVLGGTCPGLFFYAYTGGVQIGRNILRAIEGRPLEPFSERGLGVAIALGNRRAAGHLKGIPLTGFPAWLVWRTLVVYYTPTTDRRVRTILDWLSWPLLGRDIVSVDMQHNLGIESSLYEAGQTIIRQGDIGRTMYLIQSGEAEVVREEPGGEKVLGVLTAGDHFGEIAVFQNVRRTATVRARSRLAVMELRRETAHSLTGALPSLDDIFRRRPVMKPAARASGDGVSS